MPHLPLCPPLLISIIPVSQDEAVSIVKNFVAEFAASRTSQEGQHLIWPMDRWCPLQGDAIKINCAGAFMHEGVPHTGVGLIGRNCNGEIVGAGRKGKTLHVCGGYTYRSFSFATCSEVCNSIGIAQGDS